MSRAATCCALALCAGLWAGPALSQAATSAPAPTATPAPDAAPVASTSATEPQWSAEAFGGWANRQGGSQGAFGLVGLSRQLGRGYVRAALTDYRSTLEQNDTALPSNFVVGSLAGGANIANWVFDGWASYGWQHYGRIAQAHLTRTSPAGTGSPYYALGADFGRIMALRPGWYVTPTLGVSYAYTRLLRPGLAPNGSHDFQSSEPTWTGTASLRLDHTLGSRQQHYIGVMAAYHLTDNGLSSLVAPADPASPPGLVHYADGWEEGTLNSSWQLTGRLWLDATASHTLGMKAGNTTAVSGGLRLKF